MNGSVHILLEEEEEQTREYRSKTGRANRKICLGCAVEKSEAEAAGAGQSTGRRDHGTAAERSVRKHSDE